MSSAERPEADTTEQSQPVRPEDDETPEPELHSAEVDPADATDQNRDAGFDEDEYRPG
ncbi:MAG: hypothetical protein ACT4O0_15430 [Pseudonocardia sp.]|jgi:hypothetical protein